MSNTERRKVLNYRNANGISPNPNNIDYGEIAIGYKKDNEAIYIKNSTNEIVDFTPISIVNLTYNDLKNLRDNSKLKPSQYYRITDFVTTVANDPEARSAGHPFDIIVLALDKNKLHEECHAIHHEGDAYFENCNLAAWKIWYCLDNDITKYMWADTANGKGVIYRMIDEWGNDCPYDFKNVQFKRYQVTDSSQGVLQGWDSGDYIGYNDFMEGLNIRNISDFIWMYTFSLYNKRTSLVEDNSSNYLHGPFSEDVSYFGSTGKGQCTYNTLSCAYGSVNIDGQFYISLTLNNIVLFSEMVSLSENTDLPSEMCCNTFGSDNYNMTLTYGPEFNKFGNSCSCNIVGGFSNSFGNLFLGNTFGIGCDYNTFGDNCESNILGDICNANSFGNDCAENLFKGYCNGNTFGDNCGNNILGDICESNTFGDNCGNNTFGNSCANNTFGHSCSGNTFGHSCSGNTFGHSCSGNTFGVSFQYNALGADVNYIEITTDKIYYTQILNGTQGKYNKKLTIEFTPETKYSQFAGFTSDNVLETWVEADDPHDGVDCGSY